MTTSGTQSASDSIHITAPNLSIDIGGTALAYRDLGPRDGVPVVLLNHWGAVLDNFDPRIVDGLCQPAPCHCHRLPGHRRLGWGRSPDRR